MAMDIVKPVEIKPLAVTAWRACQLLECTPSQLARLIKRGRLEVVWLDPKMRRITVASIERLVGQGAA